MSSNLGPARIRRINYFCMSNNRNTYVNQIPSQPWAVNLNEKMGVSPVAWKSIPFSPPHLSSCFLCPALCPVTVTPSDGITTIPLPSGLHVTSVKKQENAGQEKGEAGVFDPCPQLPKSLRISSVDLLTLPTVSNHDPSTRHPCGLPEGMCHHLEGEYNRPVT